MTTAAATTECGGQYGLVITATEVGDCCNQDTLVVYQCILLYIRVFTSWDSHSCCTNRCLEVVINELPAGDAFR